MAIVPTPPKYFLGANLINPKVYFTTISKIIANLNAITSGNGILLITKTSRTASVINATATATVAQVSTGYITSTSAAPVTITLPTATALASSLGATAGTTFTLLVDNSAGANTVTIALGTGITVATPANTGGATLTVSTANVVAEFRFIFTSATTAIIARVI